MSSQGFNCGQCCAGEFCTNEHRQLRPDVTCTTCGKILHLLCGIGGQEEDTFDCKKCYNQKQKKKKENKGENVLKNIVRMSLKKRRK